MTNASRPTFLRPFVRAATPRRAPELADMGTAFALDEAVQHGSYDSIVPGDSPPPTIRAAVPVAPWRLWLGRKLGG